MRKRIVVAKLLFLPVIGMALISHHVYQDGSFVDLSLEITGLALIVACAMGRVWTAAYISGNKNTDLVVDGPYSIVRNPLYFFSLLGFVGMGLAFESVALALMLAILFFATHLPAIASEEQKLRDIFGQQYDDYVWSVPRLIPRSWRPSNPGVVKFKSSMYSRAVLDCSLIMCVFMIGHTIEWAHLNQLLPVVFRLP
jgi:protein-S-isoprenylcysteine O-methyltransferase Ste14